MKKILSFFSYIFHPLFISVYAALFYFYFGNHYFIYHEIYLITIQLLIITILIPVLIYYLLLSLGEINSIMISNTAQRRIPLFIHAVLLFILTKKSITLDAILELHYFFIGSIISTIVALLLTFFNYKASLHMIGITALTLFAIGISIHYRTYLIEPIAFFIFCIGLVASSRIAMKAHTYNELIVGFFVGLIPQAALWYFWL